MFLKYLKITKGATVIRNIKFKKGLNLIVDNSTGQITGNNVGKTTILKLIDYCLGADKRHIWEDPENKKSEYSLVKNFLVKKEVLITLCLVDNLDFETSQIIIERNFISRGKGVIRNINKNFYTEENFQLKLKELILLSDSKDKPTFRQVISHNIRYKDDSLNNTLKTLNKYTTDVEYEILYLYLFGCDFSNGDRKQGILEAIKQENKFKSRLEQKNTKSAYEMTLKLINKEIEELNKKKEYLNINEDFEQNLSDLNTIKYKINSTSSELSKINIRKNLIFEAKKDLINSKSNIDMQQLKMIYEQASDILGPLQRSFEELVNYHNQMAEKKKEFIMKELPEIEVKLNQKNNELKDLLIKEKELTKIISKSDSFEELEDIITRLNDRFKLKGAYENTISQLDKVEENLLKFQTELKSIDDVRFASDAEEEIKSQLFKFNQYFSSVSELLYNEKYAIKYDIEINKKAQKLYKFNSFNTNFSSGKKQGEISCFDIAYTLFADQENIPCLHFLLNDKKELMHDNQLVKIADFVEKNNMQFVAAILKDKLPDELNDPNKFIIELSEDSKLFKIEEQKF